MSIFWKLSLLGIVFILSMLLVGQGLTKLHFNRSGSSPYEAFLCVQGLNPSLGDLVSIVGHDTAYFHDLHYTKRVWGLPGDRIEIKGRKIFVGGREIGTLREKTMDGRDLNPLNRSVIPSGYVFVVGDHPHSFDSRYEEFGLVKQSNIAGKCYGLWRRKAEV